MEINKLRSIIKEAVSTYNLKEIEEAAENAAMDAKLEAYDKAIKQCEGKIHSAENIEEIKDLMDDGKVNELKKHLKNLQKSKEKLEKVKAKKNKGKEVVTDEPVDEPAVEEGSGPGSTNYNSGDDIGNANYEEGGDPDFNEYDDTINELFLKMQKLAGVITEGQYNQKKRLIENQLNENVVLDAMGTVLLGGVGLILTTAVVGGGAALAYDNIMYGPIGDAIVKMKRKIDDREFKKYIKPILIRFKDDQELQDIIKKGSTSKEIETYLESKLQPKELKYLENVAQSLWWSDYAKSDELEKI